MLNSTSTLDSAVWGTGEAVADTEGVTELEGEPPAGVEAAGGLNEANPKPAPGVGGVDVNGGAKGDEAGEVAPEAGAENRDGEPGLAGAEKGEGEAGLTGVGEGAGAENADNGPVLGAGAEKGDMKAGGAGAGAGAAGTGAGAANSEGVPVLAAPAPKSEPGAEETEAGTLAAGAGVEVGAADSVGVETGGEPAVTEAAPTPFIAPAKEEGHCSA